MALDQQIDALLHRWAEAVLVGDGSGYPMISTVHPDWTPPAPGERPSMKVHAGGEVVSTVHQAIAQLPIRLRNTVVVRYCYQLTVAEQAVRLECEPDTVLDRLERAHRLLRRELVGVVAGGFCNIQEMG